MPMTHVQEDFGQRVNTKVFTHRYKFIGNDSRLGVGSQPATWFR